MPSHSHVTSCIALTLILRYFDVHYDSQAGINTPTIRWRERLYFLAELLAQPRTHGKADDGMPERRLRDMSGSFVRRSSYRE